jgi:hypothetical protein
MYDALDAMVWVFMTIGQASVFDANSFSHHISQLTQLIRGNIPHPERFDLMIYIEQGEELLPQISSNLREEFLQQVVSGIYDTHVILQNLSEQDTCSNSKDLIRQERNAVDLCDQRDSKGQMSLISFKQGFPTDHLQLARNVLNQLPEKFPANSIAPCNEVWNIGNRTFGLTLVQLHALSSIQQLHLYAIVFQSVLASNQRAVVELEEATYNPLICYENTLWTKKQPATFGSVVGMSSWLTYAQQGLG